MGRYGTAVLISVTTQLNKPKQKNLYVCTYILFMAWRGVPAHTTFMMYLYFYRQFLYYEEDLV